MTRKHSPIIPLGRDTASRFFPVVFGLMVYLAGLALSAVLVLDGAVKQVSEQGIDTLTVEVPPDAAGETAARAMQVQTLLDANPEVAATRLVSDDEVSTLLRPWLGANPLPDDLFLPRLIDVTLKPGASVEASELAASLAAEVPGTRVDNPKAWLDRLGTFGRSLALVAGIVAALVIAATAVMAIVSTRMAISVHREVVELLHQMGARDAFVARLFQFQAFRAGLIGGVIGAALAALTLIGLQQTGRRLDGLLFVEADFDLTGFAVIGALPLLTAALAMLTARFAVLDVMRRLL
ncbi:MAG: FtsX-like permease family protein [Alphaproteobacteria bacterium]|nr:FtsX-like permease family protein [Alphaproteobacteria bacterium]